MNQRAISICALLGIALCLFACNPKIEGVEIVAPEIPSQLFTLVLGIAQDAGYPQLNCTNKCCELVRTGINESQMVSCLGIVDPIHKKYWLIDATPSIVEQCSYIESILPGAQLVGIFLTHAHIGHYTGLMMLGHEALGAKEIPVWAMPRMKSFLENNGPWSQLVSLKNIVIHEMNEKGIVKLTDDVGVENFLVPHRDEFSETVGYRIYGPSKKIIFIPDIDKWEKWDRNIQDEVRKSDLAFLDGTFYKSGELPGRDMKEIPHPFIQESVELFSELDKFEKEKIYFIHLNHTNPLLWSKKDRMEFQQNSFHVAETGMTFIL